jgi:ATP-dependent DNA helicase PIF1
MYKNDNNYDFSKFRGLLEEYNQTQEPENQIEIVQLSETQQRAMDLFTAGKNVFIIGSGGHGKSMLVKEMRYKQKEKRVVVTATTGIAAYNINGVTINSFMGIGTGDQSVERLINKIRRKQKIAERIRMVDILIIDEISMASAELFEKINVICQIIRRSSMPFGGIQVILTGDLLQLLPVFNKNESLFPNQDKRLIFESEIFNRYFDNTNTVELKTNFRQNDKQFIELLKRIRTGVHTKKDIDLLKTRLITNLERTQHETISTTNFSDVVHLVSSNKQAQIINLTNLNGINEVGVEYKAQYIQTGDKEVTDELTSDIRFQFNQKGIDSIHLKRGARVMLIKNLEVEIGLVNGSVGTITKFEEVDGNLYPFVEFDNGVRHLILPEQWELEYSQNSVKAIQIPLMLCWAITIHKSQSLTLEKAILDLGDCFCEHQVYVALSRLRSLDGLYLNSLNAKKIMVHQKVLEFLKRTNK